MERWEERLRARTRLRRAAARARWLLGVVVDDDAVVVTVAHGARAAGAALLDELSIAVRVELREAPRGNAT